MPQRSEKLPQRASGPVPVQTVGPPELSSPYEDLREHPRVPFRGRAQAIVMPPSTSLDGEMEESEVMTSDVSRGGVSILYRAQLAPGQQLLLMLNDTNQLVEVCWCCRVWEGLYAAGCRFVGVPGQTAIDQRLMAIDVVISGDYKWDEEAPS